jgi:uncharacterized protein
MNPSPPPSPAARGPGRPARPPDPRRLDVVRFAAAGAELDGTLGAPALRRLTEDAPLVDDAVVRWALRGEQRRSGAAEPQNWLHLQASVDVVLTCQRCLQPLRQALVVERDLRFVADEAEAERLDEDSDDDVLALPGRGLDVPALVEDELILALPLVPRHERCPKPLPGSAPEAAPDAGLTAPATRRPFEVLRALREPPDAASDD